MNNKNVKTVEKLNQLLADYQVHYQTLRGLHWNVKGQLFFALHDKFEKDYNRAAEVIDEIAERILMLDGKPLDTFTQYVNHAKLDQVSDVSNGLEGIRIILSNQQYFLNQFTSILNVAAGANDEGTVALLSEWISETEKEIWMLKAFLS